MWTSDEERSLFKEVSSLNARGQFEQALDRACQLLEQLERPSYQYTYVLGCRIAVSLWHLGRLDEAKEAFARARLMAEEAQEPAVLAYIISDQAQVYEGDEAATLAHEAIRICRETKTTPDPDRNTIADLAYLHAAVSRVFAKQGRREEALLYMTGPKVILRRYAYGLHPRYRDAYLMVLGWELGLRWWPRTVGAFVAYLWLGVIAVVEAARQRKLLNWLGRLASRL